MKASEMKYFRLTFIVCCFLFCTALLYAHSGGTDSRGGHRNQRTGSYHYHGSGSGIGFVGIGRAWNQIAIGASRSTHTESPQQVKMKSRSSTLSWSKSSMRSGDNNKRAWSRMVANIQARAVQVTSLDIKQGEFIPGVTLKVMFFLIWVFQAEEWARQQDEAPMIVQEAKELSTTVEERQKFTPRQQHYKSNPMEQWMQECLRMGVLKNLDRTDHEVAIDPVTWRLASVDEKWTFMKCVHVYFDGYATIVSSASGRPLASYNAWSGVKIHD